MLRRRTRLITWFCVLPAVIMSSCAHNSVSSSQNGSAGFSVRGEGGVDDNGATVLNSDGSLNDGPVTENDLRDSGEDMKKIPHEVNRLVLQWVDYFQGRGRPHMERYLSRSGKYLPMMKAILHEKGMPEDLVYIALIESGFSATAHSSASAVGYWQFIRGTGRRYNLRVDSYVDERRDFVKATHAAADYFKTLYGMFGSWYLAIASYNVGENRIKNLVQRHHTRDFWDLAQGKKLPAETVNYVPKFLAARMIAKDPNKYGFSNVEYMKPLTWAEVEVNHSVDLRKMAEGLAMDADELIALNPAYKRGIAFEKDGQLTLRIPEQHKANASVAAASAGVVPGAALQATLAKLSTGEEEFTLYKIRRGDTLASIARRFRTSTRVLRRLNGMRGGVRIIAGKRIKVPGESLAGRSKRESSSSSPRREIARADRASKTKVSNVAMKVRKVHVVRRGDTLIDIARKHRVSLTQLASANRITRKSKVNIGARLEIPH